MRPSPKSGGPSPKRKRSKSGDLFGFLEMPGYRLNVRFFGVRGSIPTPAKENLGFGGNTACLEIRSGENDLMVIDAGTGARLPAYWFEARRWFFLKNHGPIYAGLADVAFLLGCALGGLRRKIQRRRDPNPSHLFMDSARHSVFFKGFKPSSGSLKQRSEYL